MKKIIIGLSFLCITIYAMDLRKLAEAEKTQYKRPGETICGMWDTQAISVPKSSEKKIISTSGLRGCVATVFYLKTKDGNRAVALAHYPPGGMGSAHKHAIASKVHQLLRENPGEIEKAEFFVVAPRNEKGELDFTIKDSYKKEAQELIDTVRRASPEMKSGILSYSTSTNRRATENPMIRDVEIVLEPDKSTLFMGEIGDYKKIDLDK